VIYKRKARDPAESMLLQQQQYSRHIYIHPFYHSIPFHSIPFHSILPIPFLEYEFGIEFHSFVVLSENLVFIPSSSRKRTPECVTKYLVTIKYFWYFFEIFGNISTNLVMLYIFGAGAAVMRRTCLRMGSTLAMLALA